MSDNESRPGRAAQSPASEGAVMTPGLDATAALAAADVLAIALSSGPMHAQTMGECQAEAVPMLAHIEAMGWRITSAPEDSDEASSPASGEAKSEVVTADDPVSAPRRPSAPGLAQADREVLLDKLMGHLLEGEEGCWLWTGSVDADGYGMLNHDGRPYRAHRLAYRLFVGEPQHSVLHKCDTPACFNPVHLYDGTHRDNARDAFARGQLARGERNGQAKLTEAQVVEVRRLYGQGVGPRELAERFGVHRQTIRLVVRGETWPTT